MKSRMIVKAVCLPNSLHPADNSQVGRQAGRQTDSCGILHEPGHHDVKGRAKEDGSAASASSKH